MRLRITVEKVLAIAILASAATFLPAPARAITTSSPDTIQAWAVNLHRLQDSWKGFVDRTAEGDYKPDIILLNEVVNTTNMRGTHEMKTFIKYLNGAMDTKYGYRHGDPNGRGIRVSTFAVVWRKDRFELRSKSDVARWRESVGSSCRPTGKTMVAVRLWDKEQTRYLVAAAVHWDKGYPECLTKNLRTTDSTLESKWPVRRITIVGGDFNEKPDFEDRGEESDPSCWYRNFSHLHDQESCESSDSAMDHSYDTVWVRHNGTDPPQSMCSQWTYHNGGKPGDGCSNKGRIDYLWARWEDAKGVPHSFTRSEVEPLIPDAGADQGYAGQGRYENKVYSDHRAVYARLLWCAPDSSACKH